MLHTSVNTDQQDRITWYFYDNLIAEITGDFGYICTDVQCEDAEEKFRNRLKLDNQTGSLTIMNINKTYAGVYKLQIISRTELSEKNFIVAVYGVEGRYIKVLSDESLTLDPGEVKKPNDVMTWYFNDTLIAEITGDQSKICTDDHCDERFRDRLEVNHGTGSLTITNTTLKDFGVYKLLTTSSSISILKSFNVYVQGRRIVSRATIYVAEGDSVNLQTDVETNQQENIRWYFNTRIAEITGDLSYICTDVQCNNGTERFRDRLKLDHQTGSLTITNIRTRDSGLYLLQISSSSGTIFVKYFYVDLIHAVLGGATDEVSVSVMEKDSVTLHTDVKMNQQEKIVWYFNGIRIAVITGDLSYTCTDVQCNEATERFRDRLKLDNQTGSLTIRDIRTTDSGHYDLQFNHTYLSGKLFIVAVTGAPAAQRAEMKTKSVKEGESVTLDPGEIKKTK
uniref:Immunoglobulin domain-containing protein n=1 Tax=Cyprinus carpio TaxID=7962 RepID=A0A8C1YNH3_CYPCA